MQLILTPEAYLTLDLALPPEVWELLDEIPEEQRAEVAEHFRLAFVAGFYARDCDNDLMRQLQPHVIQDPCAGAA